jgi:hypothetical protein
MNDTKRRTDVMRADLPPTEGFSLMVDGKFKLDYADMAGAMKVARELKKKFPVIQVAVYDAAAKTRTPVDAE